MAAPRDDRQRVVEQRLLDDVVDRRRIAQRADQEIDDAIAQPAEQPVVGGGDDPHPRPRPLAGQRVERVGQQFGAGERHRADDDLAGVGVEPFADLGEALQQFGMGERGVAGEDRRRRRQLDALARGDEQRRAHDALEVARGAVDRRLRQLQLARGEAEIAVELHRRQRAQLRDGQQPREAGDAVAGAARLGAERLARAALDQREGARDAVVEQQPDLGRPHAVGADDEQLGAEPRLELGQRLGDRRLRKMDAFGGARRAAMFDRGGEGAQVTQVGDVGPHDAAATLLATLITKTYGRGGIRTGQAEAGRRMIAGQSKETGRRREDNGR